MSHEVTKSDDSDSQSSPPANLSNGAEGDSSNPSWLSPLLLMVTRVILRFPVTTLAVAVGLAAICVAYAVGHLGYKSSRLDLLNPKSDYNRLWIEYINEFGDEDDAVIVVDGPSGDQVVPVLAELSTALGQEKRLFHAILHEVNLSKIRAKGLHYVPKDQLQAINHFLDDALPITGGEWSRLQVGKLIGGMTQLVQAASAGMPGVDLNSAIAQLDRTVSSLLAQFATSHYQSPWPEMPDSLAMLSQLGADKYLVAKNGKMGFVLLRVAVNKEELAQGSEAIDALRELIADTMARHPQVKIGLTGLPIMENDEMRASQSSMFWGGLLSFIGVVIVVIAGFGGVRHALMANMVLLIGTAWAFGYAALVVGHLNILSITFTATLVGVGIDYGTYYVSRYMQMRREGHGCEDALLRTTKIAGPAIITGAMTTVVAFFATGTTTFTGIAELGIIAGGGILLCALAQLFVLPALVRVVDESSWGSRFPRPLPVHTGIGLLMKAPRSLMVIALLVTVVAGTGVHRLWYDYNLLNMQPEGLESVNLEHRLLTECDQSMWFALSVADTRDQLLELKGKFEKLKSVERTEDIASLLRTDDDETHATIATINSRLASLPERPPLIGIDAPDELGAVLEQSRRSSFAHQRRDRLRPPFGIASPDDARPARLRLLRQAVAVSAANGRRTAQPAARAAQYRQSGTAAVSRFPAKSCQPVRRSARQIPVEDLRRRRYLEHGIAVEIRSRRSQRRPQSHRQPVASLRMLVGNEAQL